MSAVALPQSVGAICCTRPAARQFFYSASRAFAFATAARTCTGAVPPI